jgi:hypothetical protein
MIELVLKDIIRALTSVLTLSDLKENTNIIRKEMEDKKTQMEYL